MDDGIANGTYQHRPASAALALFTAPRVDYSLHRLRHYTGTAPEWFQNFVLFTNYQFYIDEFVRLGHAEMARPTAEYVALWSPARGHAPRGPARAARDDTGRTAAAPSANARLPSHAAGSQRHHHGQHRRGPSNAKTITDHIAVLRPAWMMLALRKRSAQQPAAGRLRAGPRLCARRPCARRRTVAAGCPFPPGEIQVALEQAVADVTRWTGANSNASCAPAPWPAPTTAIGAAADNTPSGASARAALWRWTWKAPPSPPTDSLPGALRHPAVRERQAAARRDQAARHGQPFLPRARGPAPAHRYPRGRHPARRGVHRLHSRKLRSFAEVAFQ